MRSTYTYAVLDVSEIAYREICAKLDAAGYQHACHSDSHGRDIIDMHGIALAIEPPAPVEPLKVGDRVRVDGIETPMTIAEIAGREARCQWLVNDSMIREGGFQLANLTRIVNTPPCRSVLGCQMVD